MSKFRVRLGKREIKLYQLFFGALVLVTLVLLVMILFKGKSINSNSSLVNDIYSYLGQNDLSYCQGLSLYSDKTVNYDGLDNSNRICNITVDLYLKEDLTVMKIDKSKKNNTCSINDDVVFATDNYEDDICTIYRFDKEKIHSNYKKVFGKELDKDEKFNLNSTTVCYPNEEYYYCGLAESFTVTVGAEPATYRSIKEATLKNNKLIIYDYFVKVVNDECYTSYTGNTTNASCTTELESNPKLNYNFLKKYGTLYKHTFKKVSDDNYYWVQSEPAE